MKNNWKTNIVLQDASEDSFLRKYKLTEDTILKLFFAHQFPILAVSTIFLGCYLYYHYHFLHKKYEGEGLLRTVYFVILISHIILAVAVVPMVLRTLYLAWKQRWEAHRWWGRLTFPIWMYVSVTGVIVYNMLY